MLKRLCLIALLLAASETQAAGERLLVWQVSTPQAELTLIGSMHLARSDIYPLRAEIVQAFAAADTLVVEVDIGGANQFAIQELMLTRGSYAGAETIADHLSPATWKLLQQRLVANGLPPMLMERMRPGLVVTTLAMVEMMKLGLSPELGIDSHFLDLARGQKNIVELETAEQQIDLLLNVANEDLLVQQTLLQMDELEQVLDELIRHWKNGDADALRELVIDAELRRNPEFRPLQERMFDQRNRAMTERIVALQRAGGRYFVVVGAGHLLGEQGIIALLKNRGQNPRQL